MQPLLLATDVTRRKKLTVQVVLIDPADDVHAEGYTHHGHVFFREFDAPASPTEDQLRATRQETIAGFCTEL